MKASVLACLALSLVAPALALPPPTMNEALVATSAGFVGFTTNGIVFSPDGETFQRTALVDGTTPFAALPVPDGAVAASSSGYLYHTDTRGDLTRPAWENQGTTIEGFAGDGRGAVALLMYHRAYVWAGGREWGEVVVDDAGRFWRIAHGLGRYWISGEVEADDESSTATIWSSSDGRSWERVALPPVPTTADGSTPQRFVHLAAAPGLVIASDPFGRAAVSRDGRTWKWTTLPRHPLADDIRFLSDGSRIVREARKDHQLVESLMTVNGETWAPRPKTSPWFAERAISGRPEKFFQVMVKAGDQPAIVSEAVHRDPARFVAERDARRTEAERIAQQKAQAEAEAKALAARQAAEKKAREEQAAAEAKALAARRDAEQKADAARAAQDKAVATVAAALEAFDRAVGAADSVAGLAAPAAKLVSVLDQNGNGKLADAVFTLTLDLLRDRGGAQGYFDFSMKVDDARLKQVMAYTQKQLSPQQREMIRGLAARVHAQPGLVVDTRGWTATKRRDAVGPKTSDALALPDVRRAAARGSVGALCDLVEAHARGLGTGKDTLLASVWYEVLNRIARGLADGSSKAQADAGSAFHLWQGVAFELIGNGGRLTDALAAQMEQAAAGGATAAKEALVTHAAALKARRESGLTFEQFYAREEDARVAAMKALQQTLAKAPAAEIDRLARAIEDFYAKSYEVGDVAWGRTLAELVTALDAGPNRPLADAAFDTAAFLAWTHCGAEGYALFHAALPAARQPAARAQLGGERLAWIEKRGAAPADWKPQPLKRGDRSGAQAAYSPGSDYDPKALFAALARGWHGAAVDLAALGDNEANLAFWRGIAIELIPALDNAEDTAAKVAILGRYESPAGLARLADDLAQRKGPNQAEVASLRQRAREGGLKDAAGIVESLTTAGLVAPARPAPVATRPVAAPAPASDEEDLFISDEAMGLGADALESTRAEMKAMGMTDADIAAFDKAQKESMAAMHKELEAKGVTAEDIGRAMNEGVTAIARDQLRDSAAEARKAAEREASPSAARDTRNGRIDVDLKWRMRIEEARRGKAYTEAEQAEITGIWTKFASGSVPRETVERFLFLGQQILRAQLALTEREDIAALVRQAHVVVFAFPLPANADPKALVAVAEERLAAIAQEARDRDAASTCPAIYRAAAERSRFPVLGPALSLPIGSRVWGYRHEVEQLDESADLMESWNGPPAPASSPPLDLPAALAPARTWPSWGRLEAAARSGHVADTIHWLNELALALRAEALRRDPDARPALPAALDQLLLVTPAGS